MLRLTVSQHRPILRTACNRTSPTMSGVQRAGRGCSIRSRPRSNDADMPAPDANVPTGGVAPGMGAPRSAGAAATPTDAAIMSPAEARAQQSTAEMQKLIEPQPAGPDTNRYVPGVRPTEAQMVQNARTSRNEKLTASEMPQGFADLARDNNDARMNFLQDIAGTP